MSRITTLIQLATHTTTPKRTKAQRMEDLLVLEGLVTTTRHDGSIHVSPMGPIVDRHMTRLRLRPFQTSNTFGNLKRHGEGVFHVTDDVEVLARACVGQLAPLPSMQQCDAVQGMILSDACQWFAFRVEQSDESMPRADLDCRVVARGTLRPFFGWNRAKHAVVEAAILATRIGLLPRDEITTKLQQLAILVDKTAGTQERDAFAFLVKFIESHQPTSHQPASHQPASHQPASHQPDP